MENEETTYPKEYLLPISHNFQESAEWWEAGLSPFPNKRNKTQGKDWESRKSVGNM